MESNWNSARYEPGYNSQTNMISSPLLSGDSKLEGKLPKNKAHNRSKGKKKGIAGSSPKGGPKNLKFKSGKGVKQEGNDQDTYMI